MLALGSSRECEEGGGGGGGEWGVSGSSLNVISFRERKVRPLLRSVVFFRPSLEVTPEERLGCLYLGECACVCVVGWLP